MKVISRPLLKVLLVEDSKILVERLAEAIRQIPAIDLVGIADTEASAIALAQQQAIDLDRSGEPLVNFRDDRAGLAARRILARLLAQQEAPTEKSRVA